MRNFFESLALAFAGRHRCEWYSRERWTGIYGKKFTGSDELDDFELFTAQALALCKPAKSIVHGRHAHLDDAPAQVIRLVAKRAAGA